MWFLCECLCTLKYLNINFPKLTYNRCAHKPVLLLYSGLKVRIKSKPDSTTREFDYAPAPFCSSLRPVTWVGLTTTETTYPHLRLHNIPSSLSSAELEDDLSFFFSTVASVTANLALVLINSENSFNLAGKLQSLSEDQIPPFPMVMVTKETGAELMRLLAQHSRDVEAMIQLPPGYKSTISIPSSPPGYFNALSTCLSSFFFFQSLISFLSVSKFLKYILQALQLTTVSQLQLSKTVCQHKLSFS